jgi:hypothetical protein
MEIVKVCKKHGKLSAELIFKRKDRNHFECRLCMKEKSKHWRDKLRKENIEKYRKLKRICFLKYKQKNYTRYLELCRKRSQRFRINNPSADLNKRINDKKERENLSDKYIKRLIFRKSNNIQVPIELIEAKRIQIKLKRKIRELTNVNKQCGRIKEISC